MVDGFRELREEGESEIDLRAHLKRKIVKTRELEKRRNIMSCSLDSYRI